MHFNPYRTGAYFGEAVCLVIAHMPAGFTFADNTNFIIEAHEYFATNMIFLAKTGKMFFAFCGFFNYAFVYFHFLYFVSRYVAKFHCSLITVYFSLLACF